MRPGVTRSIRSARSLAPLREHSRRTAMDFNRFTEKAQEALAESQRLATRLGHQQVEAEHLLLAMLDQDQGLAPAILNKAQVPVDAVQLRIHRELERLPRVSGPSGEPEQIHVGPGLNRGLVQ